MPEKIVSAYTTPNVYVTEGFVPMPEAYQQVTGLVTYGQTFWDRRQGNSIPYCAPDIRLPEKQDELPLPPAMGEVMRVRSSSLEPTAIDNNDRKLAGQALADVLRLTSEEVPFIQLTEHLKRGNTAAVRSSTYPEALYALELARLLSADTFQHRIACYELSLTAALYCHARQLAVQWCLGVSLCSEAAPHAWLEVDGTPVRGASDEVVAGAYRKLFQV